VCLGSIIEGKRVKEMNWPSSCLLVGVKRGHEEIIPNGDTKIYIGDYLIVLANEDDAADIRECISANAEECAVVSNSHH
jgi:Trk K+ transport system NAD-binding subunit